MMQHVISTKQAKFVHAIVEVNRFFKTSHRRGLIPKTFCQSLLVTNGRYR